MPRPTSPVAQRHLAVPSASNMPHRCSFLSRLLPLWMICLPVLAVTTLGFVDSSQAQQSATEVAVDLGQRARTLLADDNLVAWCIVPFDAAKRSPQQRAKMLTELGLKRCAYDWRDEHVLSFEEEIVAYQENDIQYTAFWDFHPAAMALFRRYKIQPAIWKMIPDPGQMPEDQRVKQAADLLEPIVQETRTAGCRLSLYNHGGWSGHPETMVAVCQELKRRGHDHVGIVWNFHHGHDFISSWESTFAKLLPWLHCLNINGMNPQEMPKILAVGKGQHEFEMLKVVLRSNYQGPIGILDHLPEIDSKVALQANLEGVHQLIKQFETEQNSEAEPADSRAPAQYSQDYLEQLLPIVQHQASPERGLQWFAAQQTACLSCHRVDQYGGTVGPALTDIGSQRSLTQLASSVLWPNHEVEDKYRQVQVLTIDGVVVRGLLRQSDDQQLQLWDPSSDKEVVILREDIEEQSLQGSVMPEGIAQAMTLQQQADLLRFLSELGKGGDTYQDELKLAFAHSHSHGPETFPYQAGPQVPQLWPNHQKPVNRQRIYEYYSQQADHYRGRKWMPLLLEPYPSLDGPDTGHWGNQDENAWRDGRWNQVKQGRVLSGITRLADQVIPRAVNLQLNDGASICYDLDRLQWCGTWRGSFLKFSDTRHGFLDPLLPGGEVQILKDQAPKQGTYLGWVRDRERVAFAYQKDGIVYLDAVSHQGQHWNWLHGPMSEHPWKDLWEKEPRGELIWPDVLETKIHYGTTGAAWEVDTIEIPELTPQGSLFFLSGLDFLPDGSALISTMQGEVWQVSGFQLSGSQRPTTAKWKKFADGLNQPLGIKVVGERIYVQCRDQLIELIDRNEDGEVDYYRCVNKAFITSPAGHDYICGLQADDEGNFYTASGNQGLLRLSPDGKSAEVLATGFRNPDGLGRFPDGSLTVPCSEGDWTPASMVCRIAAGRADSIPHYGYRGPQGDRPPTLPWFYLPRGMDNSSAEQIWCDSSQWGPIRNQAIHLSFGMGRHFQVLADRMHPEQAAVIPLPGDFDSGIHRGRFHPEDGQLYVVGMTGWGTYTPNDGCFQRVRFAGAEVQIPVGFSVHQNGVQVHFSQPVQEAVAGKVMNHFAQCWNYRYGPGYGSPEMSSVHPGIVGHDSVTILSSHVLNQGKTLFLEIPDIQPVNQLHLNLMTGQASVTGQQGQDLFITVHQLAPAFTQFPGYRERSKRVAAHPILVDMSLLNQKQQNPHAQPISPARAIRLQTGQNLTYQTPQLKAFAGESLAVTLVNPDVVPHNWVLVQPGKLSEVGKLANHLISDPMAVARQYVPQSSDVLVYTDVVDPQQEFTVYFKAPEQPGNYPFLCTFPGHWMVMNGTLTVTAAENR